MCRHASCTDDLVVLCDGDQHRSTVQYSTCSLMKHVRWCVCAYCTAMMVKRFVG